MVAPGSSESARREGAHPGGASAEGGRIVGSRYRLLGKLGSGGMGSVYLCEHLALGRRYALKLLQAGPERDEDLVGRFRQEAQAASRIDQENVVDVVDFGEDPGGELYYVMELLQGRTLTQLMREDWPLPVPRALGLLEQVCRALAAAHAAGVVHRDVKPDNVLVERLADGGERAKLIDFGISHLPERSRLTRDGEIIGTPEYMAPEQAAGAGIDELTDVYAAGVLAFELLTGSLPIVGATAIATLVAHQSEAPPPPSSRRHTLTPEIDALVLRALSKRKADRHPTMQAFAAEVTRLRVSASLASVARRSDGGGWSDETAGTGRGGTIGLAAVPYPVTPLEGDAPVLPAPAEEPAPPPSGWRRRRALVVAIAAVVVAIGVIASMGGHATPTPTPTSASSESNTAARPEPFDSAARSRGSAQDKLRAEGPESRGTPTPTQAPPPDPTPVAAPRRLEDDGPAPPRPPPAGREDPLRDPYAAPGDPLKPDPFK